MEIKIKTTGERKTLASLIGETITQPAIYAKMPTCAYHMGAWTLDKEGYLLRHFDWDAQHEILNVLYAIEDSLSSVLSLRFDMPAPISERARNILESKRFLIEAALVGSVSQTMDETKSHIGICITTPSPDVIIAAAILFDKIFALAKQLNYASSTQKTVLNEKYAFRCFLLRLGFIGNDYKEFRKTLLYRMPGNSSLKGGAGHVIAK